MNGGRQRFDPTWLRAQLRRLLGPLRTRRLCVAYSGGLDSTALLAALAALRRREGFMLRAVHVDHGLQAGSAAWARAARRQARALDVRCTVIALQVAVARGASLEAAARTARYAALATQLGSTELLVTAHHREDQLETLLLALLRGSGLRGLAAMAAVSPWHGTLLLRPLLPIGRAALEQYVRARRLHWVEDPSNLDLRFDRNYLRHQVLPAILLRWPAAASTVGRSAEHLAEAGALLEQLARRTLRAAQDGAALRISTLRRLTEPERRNALRSWLLGLGLPLPDHRRLAEMAGPMLQAREDATPWVQWAGAEVRRHGDRLWAAGASATQPTTPVEWQWRECPELPLAAGGTLQLCADLHGDLNLDALPAALWVRFRTAGERLRDARGSLPLKDLLQRCGVPPWQRASVPLLYDSEQRQIIAVGDLWAAPPYRVDARTPDGATRGRLRWRRHDD